MQIIVIGGGAAGLTAAIGAAKQGAHVILLEGNAVFGKKLLATGNGKCNYTNRVQDPSCWNGQHPEFASEVIRAFGFEDTIRFFRSLGICPKERNGGIYPFSEQASAVRDVLVMEARYRKVRMKTREKVTAVKKNADGFSVRTETYIYRADRVILAAGSCASAIAGSGRSGYEIAASFGHTIVTPLPALVGLRGIGSGYGKWAGVRFEAGISLYRLPAACTPLPEFGEPFAADRACNIQTERGEVQFTDYGISGIPVFQLSGRAGRELENGGRVTAVLDFLPDLSETETGLLLEERLQNCRYKSPRQSLTGLFPEKLADIFCRRTQDPKHLTKQIKAFSVPVKGAHSLRQAQTVSGGIATDEICSTTMESLLVPGLYFAGEVIDVDGRCGGYNLQWAWSSGTVAGMAAGRTGPRSRNRKERP